MMKNIIFDMGGVIVDVHLDRAVEKFKALGVKDAGELIDSSHHKGIFIDFENGNIDTGRFCELLNEHVGKTIPPQEIESAWKSIISPPLEYKMDYIKELRKKYKLYILTNNNPVILNWACSKGFTPSGDSLSDCFDKIYASYKMKCTKPDLKIFRMMIEDAGINPEESLYIDDSEHNLIPARKLGMHVYLAKNGEDWRQDVEELLTQVSIRH
jgi:putative hydrolase of the HAD superfamily